MMEIKLSTEVGTTPSDWKIGHHSRIATIGSCFADVLGSQLGGYKFPVLNNDFGTAFNPLAIAKILDITLEGKEPNQALFLENPDKIWLHHDFHSSLYGHDREALHAQLTDKLVSARVFLKEADVLVITFGTAFAYRHKQTNLIVGNCHKQPADRFLRELLHPDQIMIAYDQLIQKLQSFQRNLRVILTVSPVRHTRDTLPLNQVSKSTLRLVCHRLSEKYKHVEYFPAYEIMVDELRDYRFYEEDMIHPTKVAEDYIFNAFAKTYIEPSARNLMKEWDAIRQMTQHRPLHGVTESHRKLLKNVLSKLKALSSQIDVTREIAETEDKIHEFSDLR
ncbi:GSCFA domain-containing protein [Dyadobacter chenhuakuii]|uniref:GSCFA domain-containing protein n=1 Tax=Dyadobacter chenhuakuii TaxID=2909339 RepID=A0ABY4XED6_9BACT|nr:GSCFA domain-containing protein [Dyadobacter chenhuakuii]MCF2492136.1 GSCFA domain-containing protein [Dyadobacter chenhuakuii]USJ28707.1 GSCFA domain-containing protein [Dyadobacter chenhuakuii]